MKDTIELIIDGSKIESIYQDGLADLLDAREAQVCRASNVEWEMAGPGPGRKGWTVRSAHSPELAIRSPVLDPSTQIVSDDLCHTLVVYRTREEALEAEVKHFWELIQGRNLNG